MAAMIQAILCFVMLHMVLSLKLLSFPVQENSSENDGRTSAQNSLRRLLSSLVNAKRYVTSGNRRSMNPFPHGHKRKHEHLRDDDEQETPEPDTQLRDLNNHKVLVENELLDTINKHSSALLHPAYVEKRGFNDFLVLEDEAQDKFVTVIPNNIYYGIEKTCVNWLDDCNLQGVRSHLLQKVRSPYKKK